MKRKQFILPVLALTAGFLAGCGSEPEHVHTYASFWSSNETQHWHTATCEHRDLKSDLGDHVDANKDEKCDVCGHAMAHTHTFSSMWSTNDQQHWHVATCGHDVVSEQGNHVDSNGDGKCDACDYTMQVPPGPNTATVTVVNGTGGGTYRVGNNVTVTATVPTGKEFKDWNDGTSVVSTANPYTFTLVKDVTLTAEFDTAKVTVTVVNGTGGGTYDYGSSVTVSPTVGAGEKFVEWQVGGTKVSGDKNYTFTATEDITLTAKIEQDTPPEEDPMKDYCQTLIMDGDEFKVLNLTDTQLHNGNTTDLTFHIIDTLVAQEEPDLINLLGDFANDHTEYGTKTVVEAVFDHIDELDIPWAPVFGNHDNEDYRPEGTKKDGAREYMMELFEDYENCLFIEGPEDVQGKSNYMVNIVDTDENLVETFVYLDSRIGGLDESNVNFYEDAINYATKLNGGEVVRSAVFDHIPILEYETAYNYAEDNECRTLTGVPGGRVLAAGTDKMFPKMKELGSTSVIMCGHDHENCFYTDWEGITLAYAMKSSEGDDDGGNSYNHPMGGVLLTVDGEKDIIKQCKVEDISFPLNSTSASSIAYHPPVLPYWRESAATLEFDIELPSAGTLQFNLQGTNLMRGTIDPELRKGAWNRLTGNVDLNAADKSVDCGTLTLIKDNLYHYSLDLTKIPLNTGAGEVACGDETVRLVYFHNVKNTTGDFKVTNVHFEPEVITETNQIDLEDASVAAIEDQFFNELPIKPDPKVTLGGNTLVEGADIIYDYKNNIEMGEATLRIIPSGKGAHKYKGEKVVTFNIIGNPDDDTLPGHENAITVNDNASFVTNDNYDEWIKVPNWYNTGKLLHLELKRLKAGLKKDGETVRFALLGANTNPVTTRGSQVDPSGTWNRLTTYYILDFSNDTVVCYQSGNQANVIATGYALQDGWMGIDIDMSKLDLNSNENVWGNENETMQRVEFSQMKRSFKYDKVSMVEKA